MNPRSVSILDYTYQLPANRIALHPLERRDESRLLVYRQGEMAHSRYHELAKFLPGGSLMVFNNTRVIAARLLFTKPSGGRIEIFCLEPGPGTLDITLAMKQEGSVVWNCLIGGASKWKPGQILEMSMPGESPLILRAAFKQKNADSFLVELSWSPPQLTFAEVLSLAGNIPLPPYLHREAAPDDSERYQTIYAVNEGSVAAPTAGLHFTPELMASLDKAGVRTGYISLHVGAGTFRPVKSTTMDGHDMHAEFIDVNIDFLKDLRRSLTENIIAVGTTSLRTLESLYWIGESIERGEYPVDDYQLDQWYPYDHISDRSASDALGSLIAWMETTGKNRLLTKTRLLIVPGYRFRIVNMLVTNFHQPESTLLLLVAAFIGDDWRKLYDVALRDDYRFLSYGDGCLLFRQ